MEATIYQKPLLGNSNSSHSRKSITDKFMFLNFPYPRNEILVLKYVQNLHNEFKISLKKKILNSQIYTTNYLKTLINYGLTIVDEMKKHLSDFQYVKIKTLIQKQSDF